MNTIKKLFCWILAAGFVAGCATTGTEPTTASSFTDELAIGYALNAEVRQTAATLLDAKKISSADAKNVLDQTNNARIALDLARSMATSNLTTARDKVATARTVLIALQVYLAARKK